MASVGTILPADQARDELPNERVPDLIGSGADVLAVIAMCMPGDNASLVRNPRIETAEDDEEPRASSYGENTWSGLLESP